MIIDRNHTKVEEYISTIAVQDQMPRFIVVG